MHRVIAFTKRFGIVPILSTLSLAWSTATKRDIIRTLFPFLLPIPHEERRISYRDHADDFLYLPPVSSARVLWYFESVSLFVTLSLLMIVVVGALTMLLEVPLLAVPTAFVALFYFVFMLFKFFVVYRSFSFSMFDASKAHIDAIPDDELPVYTVLVPLRDEAEVMDQIVAAMSALDYPTDKLDLIVTVEEYDVATREALARAHVPPHWRICVLPDTQPKTKPKALNVAFREVRGEFLVIYDAEIIPDHDQLKKAVLAFRHNPHIACFQTRLDHYNINQNLITKLFNTEFSFHYDLFLPGLQSLNAPIPLSGHSTHFRTQALVDVGAWDPYNLTEDCELGIRLARSGYRTGIMNSISREEAASTISSWIKQRTRWMKGFIQTSIVHLRSPVQLRRDLGSWWKVLMFIMLVPGTVLLNLLNFVSWLVLMAWCITGAPLIQDMYPALVLYIANIAAIVGGFTFMYLNLVALWGRNRFHLIRFWFLTPLYWLLLSVATVRALWQLRSTKTARVWEKTVHGTHLPAVSPS